MCWKRIKMRGKQKNENWIKEQKKGIRNKELEKWRFEKKKNLLEREEDF